MFSSNNYRHGGTRGGQDQFKWEDVKSDKDRESYLGHSVHAPVGRWQKGKDLFWYTRTKKRGNEDAEREAQLAAERAARKQADEEMLNQALGIVSKKRKFDPTKLEAADLKELLVRGSTDRSEVDIERIEGLGAAPSKSHDHIKKRTLAERELARLKKEQEKEANSGLLLDVSKHTRNFSEDSNSSDSGQKTCRRKNKKSKKKKKRKKEKDKISKESKKKRKHKSKH